MKTLFAVFVALALLVVVTPAAAKSYAVDRVESDVVVEEDGSLRFTEQITFRYKGRFKFAFRNIPLKEGEELTDVRVSEGGTDYVESSSKRPGNFRVRRENGEARITWYYRARNEQRVFTLYYTLSGVVQRHADVAELYVQFVGDQWDRPIRDAQGTLHLPETIDTAEVRAWAHGPLHGLVRGVGTPTLTYSIAPLPARQFWEARVVLPAGAFPSLPVSSSGPRLDAILSEERAWAEEANRRREAEQLLAVESERRGAEREAKRIPLLLIALTLGLIALGVWFRLFLSYGAAHEVQPSAPPGEVPSPHSPAMLSFLLHRSVSGRAVVATLLDLAQRGYFEVREKTEQESGWFGKSGTVSDFIFERTSKDAAHLAPYEAELIAFLAREVGSARGFSMNQLKAVARKNRRAFYRWFVAWKRRVKEAGRQEKFFEPYAVTPMALNTTMGGLIAILGLGFCIYNESAVGIPAIAGGLLQAILTVSLVRHTPHGRRLVLEWEAFKRHLESISKGLGPVTLDSPTWGRYLAAALVFGMHDTLLPNLRVATADRRGAVYPVWYHGVVHSDAGSGVASLSAGFSSMIAAMSTTVSSASGASSGGASGGGGGGSGGGGGGAG